MQYRMPHLSLLFIVIGFFGCNPDSGEVVGSSDEVVYDYSLIDVNASSATYGENIGPSNFENQVTLHYFGHQT
tara:strand:+ start:72 stop:290 length:219 start_codon:yes stop_codon:yes gene_type:complete